MHYDIQIMVSAFEAKVGCILVLTTKEQSVCFVRCSNSLLNLNGYGSPSVRL